ncbi:MAG: hypothetical protein ACRD3Q_01560, partial [Terriglobales bacterium]
YATDDSVFVVLDVSRRLIIIDSRKSPKIPEVLEWYHDAAGYFFTTPDESKKGGELHAKEGSVFRLDLARREVSQAPISTSEVAKAHKVTYDFDPRHEKDCTATPQ